MRPCTNCFFFLSLSYCWIQKPILIFFDALAVGTVSLRFIARFCLFVIYFFIYSKCSIYFFSTKLKVDDAHVMMIESVGNTQKCTFSAQAKVQMNCRLNRIVIVVVGKLFASSQLNFLLKHTRLATRKFIGINLYHFPIKWVMFFPRKNINIVNWFSDVHEYI